MAQFFKTLNIEPFYAIAGWGYVRNIIAEGGVSSNLLSGIDLQNFAGQIMTKAYDTDLAKSMTFTMIESTATDITAKNTASFSTSFPVVKYSDGFNLAFFDTATKFAENPDVSKLRYTGQVREAIFNIQQSVLKTMFDTAFATGGAINTHKISTYAASSFSGTNLRKELVNIFGEKRGLLDTIVIHSVTENQMRQERLITDVAPVQMKADNLTASSIAIFDGMRVLVNDTMCAAVDGVYPVYVFAKKGVSIEYNNNILLLDIPSSVGGGTITRQVSLAFAPIILGLNYKSNLITKTAIETASNWEAKWDSNEILLANIEFGG